MGIGKELILLCATFFLKIPKLKLWTPESYIGVQSFSFGSLTN
ncbi:hypothetical protein BGP_2268 [Beggiatoa sp. PS]|nr:hypothetical protein BGP_2268 [Beggiatoa sp. PS]